jgi:hypothetical protein
MTEQAYRGVPHTPWAKDGKVFLSNDEDSHYTQEFHNRKELEAFIQQLRAKADEAWNKYCEASLDLSNQEDVGERETAALAALDRLYAQNADGMKRLADS